ncbi:MAG TPA: amidohydrolase family protein [Gemmatimonadaceae bacterium]|nr:amidohydrolase family protein [Gemmatimonadaceae bacterium]HRQ77059.1 amidohydrolase family protein [Gemmatimonadaceae bacterium]
MLRSFLSRRPTVALLAGLMPAAAVAQVPRSAPAPVAFTNVTVLTMDGDRRLDDHTVIVRDGKIAALGPSATTQVPAGVTRVDGRGKFLMPGLAEMHAHVPPGNPTREQLEDIMFLYVANGITTIRGMLGAPYQIQLKAQLESGAMLGPQFFPAAPSLNGNSAPTPEAAVALVRQAKATGYDLVKIHPGVSRATWDAAVAEMRAQGLTFGGHIPFDVGIVHAMRTGIATIDHVDGYLEAAVRDSAVYAPGSQLGDIIDAVDPAKFPALARMARELQVWNVPTMYLWENFYNDRTAEELGALPEMQYVSPQQVTAWMNQKRGRALADENQRMTPERRARYLALRRQMLKALTDAGAPLLMGTDSPQMFNVPGYALHRELQVARAAGLTPQQVLESGTRNVGRYVRESLKQDGNFGTVAVGQWADLVLLDADPTVDLERLTRRSGVMLRGRWVSATEIAAGLERIRSKHAAARRGN